MRRDPLAICAPLVLLLRSQAIEKDESGIALLHGMPEDRLHRKVTNQRETPLRIRILIHVHTTRCWPETEKRCAEELAKMRHDERLRSPTACFVAMTTMGRRGLDYWEL